MIPSKWAPLAGAAALGLLAGILAGWGLWRPKAPKVETYAQQIRQKDGSLVLERKPQADAKPAQEIPKGAKVERIVQVTVQPRAPQPLPAIPTRGSGPAAELQLPQAPECPPVRVDLSLVRMPDQSRRVIASSPDGQVVGGVDIPVEAAKPAAKPLNWAAGGLWNPGDHTYGAFIDRDLGPFRTGVEVFQQRAPVVAGGAVTWAAQVKVGIRF